MLKRKNKTVYLDTNVVLDFLLKRRTDAMLLIESLRSRKWTMITSSFTMVEMSDWKKRDLFMRNKVELNWGMDSIFGSKNKTDLGAYEFEKVSRWLLDSGTLLNISFIDLADSAGWQALRDISANTNLLAKDSLHLCTALISALNKQCDTLITEDGDFIKEANKYLKLRHYKQKLEVCTSKDFVKKFPPSY